LSSFSVQPDELSKRLAIFYSAALMAGAFGGLLAGVITEYMDGLGSTPGWQWLFIIEGLGTVVIAVVAVFILPGESVPSNEMSV
jgi:MFS family permease